MFIAGVIIFFGIHLIPMMKQTRALLRSKLGVSRYKGIFSLLSLLGLLLIIFGFDSSSNNLYAVNENAYLYARYIMPVSFTLLVSANMPTFIKKTIRHPMSLGIAIWATLHLLVNPDMSSVVLFGSFLVYAVMSVLFSDTAGDSQANKSDPKISFDILSVAIGFLLTFLAFNFHDYLSGISLS